MALRPLCFESSSGTGPLDLVISRQASDLRIAVHGTSNQVTIQNWYAGAASQVETIQAANGYVLLSTQVDRLIQAMASFSQQPGLTWDQDARSAASFQRVGDQPSFKLSNHTHVPLLFVPRLLNLAQAATSQNCLARSIVGTPLAFARWPLRRVNWSKVLIAMNPTIYS